MKRLLTPSWIARHVGAVALVVAFSALGWWQISRAIAGNALSWAYAVEWPVFAGFVIFVWIREVRHTLRGDSPDADSATGPLDTAEPARALAATGVAGPVGAPADARGPGGAAGIRRPVRAVRRTTTADEDPELDEYNRYLAWRNANPDARISDYPG
ncbi:hypothetical protein [Polymorphospora sp. NPDC050346]|uniref:hypothetical protein n=1 Tax=Polymorphospora sp. NPDC050346 TaxID=3155780 RepID=UPI0033C21005